MSNVSGVSGVSSSNSTSSTSSTSTPGALSYTDFLSLLLAEMKNQDPTQPMDPTQMVTQLATINQVAQQVETNTKLASLLTTSALTQSELAVGSDIESTDGTTSGQVESVAVDSTGAATATLTTGDTVPFADGAIIR